MQLCTMPQSVDSITFHYHWQLHRSLKLACLLSVCGPAIQRLKTRRLHKVLKAQSSKDIYLRQDVSWWTSLLRFDLRMTSLKNWWFRIWKLNNCISRQEPLLARPMNCIRQKHLLVCHHQVLDIKIYIKIKLSTCHWHFVNVQYTFKFLYSTHISFP